MIVQFGFQRLTSICPPGINMQTQQLSEMNKQTFPHILLPNILFGWSSNMVFKDAETASALITGPEHAGGDQEQDLNTHPKMLEKKLREKV